MPLCAAFNLLQLDTSGAIAVNTAQISYLKVRNDGSLEVGMVGGKQFVMTPEQADELVDATRRALQQAVSSSERRIAVPGRGM